MDSCASPLPTSLNIQVKLEPADTDIMNESNRKTIETVDCNSKKDMRETENFESEAKLKKEDKVFVTEVDVSYENYPIKNEPLDVDEEQDVEANSYVFACKLVGVKDIKIEIKPENPESCEENFENTVKEEYMSDEGVSFNDESNKDPLAIKTSKSTKSSTIEIEVARSEKLIPKTRAQINKEYRERQKIKQQSQLPSEPTKVLITETQVIRPEKKTPKSRAQINKEYRERQKIKKLTEPPSNAPIKSRAEYMKEYRRRVKLKNQSIQLNTLLAKYHSEQRTQYESESEKFDQSDIQATTADASQAEQGFAFQNMENIAGPLPTVTTTCNITSMDGAQDRESTVGPTWDNRYDSDSNNTEETAANVKVCSNESIRKSVNNCDEDIKETKLLKDKERITVEFNDKGELTHNEYHSSIKDRIVFEDDINGLETLANSTDTIETSTDNSYVDDPCNISQINSSTSNVNSNSLMSNDTESWTKPFICYFCDKRFQWKSTMKRHIQKHSKNPKTYNCTYCSYKTVRKFDLYAHINSQHTKCTSFNCSYCNYTSYHKGALNQHIISHHKKSTVFNCSYCNYKAYQKSSLDLHINSQHTKRTVFNCSYCSYKAYYKSNLNQHLKAKHSKELYTQYSQFSAF